MNVHIHCLHGSLQGPEVWTPLRPLLERPGPCSIRVVAEDVLALAEEAHGPLPWASGFCEQMGRAPRAGQRVLLGYSLGGRLALHALLACPGQWNGAIVVSAHPGEQDAADRRRVRDRDRRWADRLATEPAAEVLRDWDALPVFGGRPNLAPRIESGIDSIRWARVFREYSRSEQADLRPLLRSAVLPPLLFVAGGDDPTYAAIAERMERVVPAATHQVIAGAGHRVPWERPGEFAEVVRRFVAATCPSVRRDAGG